MVSGMQEKDAAGHPLVLAYLKHFTSYSQEAGRDHNNYNISVFDFWDTYLPQFEAAFRQAGASGVMASYASENGHRTKVTICLHTTRSPKRAPAQNLAGCVTFRSICGELLHSQRHSHQVESGACARHLRLWRHPKSSRGASECSEP